MYQINEYRNTSSVYASEFQALQFHWSSHQLTLLTLKSISWILIFFFFFMGSLKLVIMQVLKFISHRTTEIYDTFLEEESSQTTFRTLTFQNKLWSKSENAICLYQHFFGQFLRTRCKWGVASEHFNLTRGAWWGFTFLAELEEDMSPFLVGAPTPWG